MIELKDVKVYNEELEDDFAASFDSEFTLSKKGLDCTHEGTFEKYAPKFNDCCKEIQKALKKFEAYMNRKYGKFNEYKI